MFNKILLLVVLLAGSLLGATASARTLSLPDEKNGVATVTIPAAWRPAETKKGTEATSVDNAVFVSVTAVPEKDEAKEVKAAVKTLKDHKVNFDENKKNDDNRFKINDLDAYEMQFEGVDQEGDASISITTVKVKDQVVVITFWASQDHFKEHKDEIIDILYSVAAVKK